MLRDIGTTSANKTVWKYKDTWVTRLYDENACSAYMAPYTKSAIAMRSAVAESR